MNSLSPWLRQLITRRARLSFAMAMVVIVPLILLQALTDPDPAGRSAVGSSSTTFLTDAPKYPAVRALIWFNQADGPSDFRINSSSASLNAFKQVLNSPTYQGRLP